MKFNNHFFQNINLIMDYEAIDHILSFLYSKPSYSCYAYELEKSCYSNDRLRLQRAMEYLLLEGAINDVDGIQIKLSSNGLSIIEKYTSFQNYKNSISSALKAEKSLKEENLRISQKQSKLLDWQLKTFWPVFIFGLIGGCLGIASFIMQIWPKDKVESKGDMIKSIVKPDSNKKEKQTILNL